MKLRLLLLLLTLLAVGCTPKSQELEPETQICQNEFSKPSKEFAVIKASQAFEANDFNKAKNLLEPVLYCYQSAYQISAEKNAPKNQAEYRPIRAKLLSQGLAILMFSHLKLHQPTPAKDYALAQMDLQEEEGLLDVNLLALSCNIVQDWHFAQPNQDRKLLTQELTRCHSQLEFVDLSHFSEELRTLVPMFSYNLACFHTQAGRKEEALLYLEKALIHFPQITELAKADKDFDPLRKDPDFIALIKRFEGKPSALPWDSELKLN